MWAGGNNFILQGFTVTNPTVGIAATSLIVSVQNGSLINEQASISGSIFSVAAGRLTETLNASNARVLGSFTASQNNYLGVDLRRTPDSTTADLAQFANADILQETPETVPLGITMDYVLVISTQDFSTTPNIAPIAVIATDSNNQVVSVTDARNMAFRLATGGSVPNSQASYSWPGGRTETGTNQSFTEGDKSISSLRDWQAAMMSRVWEIGGGERWYSPTADRNVKMTRSGAPFSNGDWFSWDGTNLLWQGLAFLFGNSTGYFNTVVDQTSPSSGLTNLAEGDCLYVDLDRTQNRTGLNALVAAKAQLNALGTPLVPGSRWIIAYRYNNLIFTRDGQFPVNATLTVATTTSTGVVKLLNASATPGSPTVLTDGSLNIVNGAAQLNSSFQVKGQGMISTATNQQVYQAYSIGAGTGVNGGFLFINETDRIANAGQNAVEFYSFDSILGLPDFIAGITDEGGVLLKDTKIIPPTPPTANYATLYVTNNGVVTPNNRQQLAVKWSDGSVTVIAEGPLR